MSRQNQPNKTTHRTCFCCGCCDSTIVGANFSRVSCARKVSQGGLFWRIRVHSIKEICKAATVIQHPGDEKIDPAVAVLGFCFHHGRKQERQGSWVVGGGVAWSFREEASSSRQTGMYQLCTHPYNVEPALLALQSHESPFVKSVEQLLFSHRKSSNELGTGTMDSTTVLLDTLSREK